MGLIKREMSSPDVHVSGSVKSMWICLFAGILTCFLSVIMEFMLLHDQININHINLQECFV
jgi:hypothetical protein